MVRNKIYLVVIAIFIINVFISQVVGVDPWSAAGIKLFIGTICSVISFIILTWPLFGMNWPKKLVLPIVFLLAYLAWFPVMEEWTTAALKAAQNSNALNALDDPPSSLRWYGHEIWRDISTTVPLIVGWVVGDFFD